MAGRDGRFSHLLQPIRDLAANWDIDVASELEEYLTELEGLVISFDGGKTNLNFAEAALLIQGSTLIYSKKVECLYDLIYKTLQTVQMQTMKRSERGRGGGPRAPTGEDADILEQEEEFLELDDVLQEADNIDLEEEEDGATLPTRTPRGMLGAFAVERRGAGDSFHIMASCMHAGGALLLDARRGMELSPIAADVSAVHRIGFDDHQPVAGAAEGACAGAGSPIGNQNRLDFDDDYGDDDDGGDGGMGDGPATPNVRPGRGGVRQAPRVDPWVSLDPHAAAGAPAKPLKVGRTYTTLKDAGAIARYGMAKAVPQPLPAVKAANAHYHEFQYAVKADRRRKARERLATLRARQQAGVAGAALLYNDPADEDSDGGSVADRAEYDDDFEIQGTPFGMPEAAAPFIATVGDRTPLPLTLSALESSAVSYEMLLRHHIDVFMRGCDKYAAETNLSKRVADWRGRMDPLLKEQDVRPAFDIETYGGDVISNLSQLDEETAPPAKSKSRRKLTHTPHNFHYVVEGRDSFDVCRVFLACLQLANDGNVELVHNASTVDAVETPLKLVLRSTERRRGVEA